MLIPSSRSLCTTRADTNGLALTLCGSPPPCAMSSIIPFLLACHSRFRFSNVAAMGRRAREHMVARFSREVVAERVEAELRRVAALVHARRQPRRVSRLVEH